jgi:hypothetical protein
VRQLAARPDVASHDEREMKCGSGTPSMAATPPRPTTRLAGEKLAWRRRQWLSERSAVGGARELWWQRHGSILSSLWSVKQAQLTRRLRIKGEHTGRAHTCMQRLESTRGMGTAWAPMWCTVRLVYGS